MKLGTFIEQLTGELDRYVETPMDLSKPSTYFLNKPDFYTPWEVKPDDLYTAGKVPMNSMDGEKFMMFVRPFIAKVTYVHEYMGDVTKNEEVYVKVTTLLRPQLSETDSTLVESGKVPKRRLEFLVQNLSEYQSEYMNTTHKQYINLKGESLAYQPEFPKYALFTKLSIERDALVLTEENEDNKMTLVVPQSSEIEIVPRYFKQVEDGDFYPPTPNVLVNNKNVFVPSQTFGEWFEKLDRLFIPISKYREDEPVRVTGVNNFTENGKKEIILSEREVEFFMSRFQRNNPISISLKLTPYVWMEKRAALNIHVYGVFYTQEPVQVIGDKTSPLIVPLLIQDTDNKFHFVYMLSAPSEEEEGLVQRYFYKYASVREDCVYFVPEDERRPVVKVDKDAKVIEIDAYEEDKKPTRASDIQTHSGSVEEFPLFEVEQYTHKGNYHEMFFNEKELKEIDKKATFSSSDRSPKSLLHEMRFEEAEEK